MPSLQEILAGIAILTITVPAMWSIVMCLYRGYRAYGIVNNIAAQFKPNGGSHMIDRLESLHEMVENLIAANTVSMNLIPYPMLRATGDGRVVWTNRQFSHEIGLNESEALDLGWLSMVRPDFRNHVRSEWFSAISDARAIRIEFTLEDGRNAVLEALPIFSVKKGVHGILGTLRIESEYHFG